MLSRCGADGEAGKVGGVAGTSAGGGAVRILLSIRDGRVMTVRLMRREARASRVAKEYIRKYVF